jgi:hypothetical protein
VAVREIEVVRAVAEDCWQSSETSNIAIAFVINAVEFLLLLCWFEQTDTNRVSGLDAAEARPLARRKIHVLR